MIRAEVTRCQNILQHMASEAGASMGEMVRVLRVATLIREALGELKWGDQIDYQPGEEDARLCVKVAPRALSFALQGILRNAREAALERGLAVRIAIRTKRHADTVHLFIDDQSGGMDEEALRRATEPFFSTKEPGKGMGLGLFSGRDALRAFRWPLERDAATGRRARGGGAATLRAGEGARPRSV